MRSAASAFRTVLLRLALSRVLSIARCSDCHDASHQDRDLLGPYIRLSGTQIVLCNLRRHYAHRELLRATMIPVSSWDGYRSACRK